MKRKLKTKKRRRHWSYKIRALGACEEAIDWARSKSSYAIAWRECDDTGWMIWLLAKSGVDLPSCDDYVEPYGCPRCDLENMSPSKLRERYKAPRLPR